MVQDYSQISNCPKCSIIVHNCLKNFKIVQQILKCSKIIQNGSQFIYHGQKWQSRSKPLTVEDYWQFKVCKKKKSWKYGDIWSWPNWWPGVTRIEVLPSYNPIPGFQVGTVRLTVTKTEKIRHGSCNYSSYTLWSIWAQEPSITLKFWINLLRHQASLPWYILYLKNISLSKCFTKQILIMPLIHYFCVTLPALASSVLQVTGPPGTGGCTPAHGGVGRAQEHWAAPGERTLYCITELHLQGRE